MSNILEVVNNDPSATLAKSYDQKISGLTVSNPYYLVLCEQTHGKDFDKVANCLTKAEIEQPDRLAQNASPSLNYFEQFSATIFVIVAAIAIIGFARKIMFHNRRGFRAFVGVAAVWAFSVGSYLFITDNWRNIEESRIIGLLLLPPFGLLLCAVLWAWYRKSPVNT